MKAGQVKNMEYYWDEIRLFSGRCDSVEEYRDFNDDYYYPPSFEILVMTSLVI
jgi:hypothetical protein